MRVVLGVADLEFVLLLDFVADYAPEGLEIFTHSEDHVQEVASVLFGVLFFLLLQLLESDPTHPEIHPAIKGL